VQIELAAICVRAVQCAPENELCQIAKLPAATW
jgi:hypothetical protein